MDETRLTDELAAARRALAAERERSQRYLDVAGAVILTLDRHHRIASVNRKGVEVLGLPPDELVGRDWAGTVAPEPGRSALRRELEAVAGSTHDAALEAAALTSSGNVRTLAWRLSALTDADGTVVGALAAAEDVTDRRRNEQQVAYLARHDTLTGLPNRALLEEHLRLALARSRRSGAGVALLHVDLDTFKLVNDSLGHAGGDRLLCALAARLEDATRATDLLARPGGDELLLLIADVGETSGGGVLAVAEQTAARIVAALQEPFAVDGTEFQVSASIGISAHPRDARDADELLSHADSAMYRAKVVARGGWTVYAQQREDPKDRLSLSTRLRRALARHELLLHYQPIFDVSDGRSGLIGVEALLRWHDPDRGMIAPGEFIPFAEETGLIEAIGDWVVGAVCEQQVDWSLKGLRPQISFNVSPRQLRRLDFTARVAEHLRRTGADPSRLTVELTESATMEDPASAEPILRDLHRLGLRLALDDFGSGHSSLARLRDMPVETLKIDRAFLREVPGNREASAIVTAILRLSSALGRTAVAEGVETEAQRRFLADEGCPLAQGFLLGRPMPASGVEALLAATVPGSPGC